MEDNNQIFDPETCPLDLLRKKIAEYTDEEDYYNTMQQSAKTFINSVYGVFGTEFFNLANTDIAESITLQGQDLIKYSVIQINDYIKNLWNQDIDGHKRVAERMKALFGDAFDYEKFMNAARTNKIMIDTMQVYGDSVTGDSVVYVGDEPVQIKTLFDELCQFESHDKIRAYMNYDVLSYDPNQCSSRFCRTAYVMRHYTNKSMWKITSDSGKSVTVTQDHSVMVYRNGVLIEAKPFEILYTDKVVVMCGDTSNVESVKNVELVSERYNDFVYDIAIDPSQGNHTFFANDILVHNTDSAYITMQPIIDACYVSKDQELDFDLIFYEEILEKYMDGKFDIYAQKFHCHKNLEKFELEKISRTIILLAKKNYMCDVEWIDSGARFDPCHHITYTGFDVVKGSTPEYCRKEMKDFVTFIMGELNKGRKPTLGELVKRLVDIKKRFAMQSPNDIAKSQSISNYESFVMNDKSPEIQYFSFKKVLDANGNPIDTNEKLPVPIHVRAAAIYNNMLFNKAKKYRSKYNLLKSGDKVRYYYTDSENVFGFVPDLFPMEFAPKMDVDIQFEKMLLSPLNRIVVALGYNEIAPSLTYTPSLF